MKTTTDGTAQVESPFDLLTDFVIFGSVAFDTLAVVALFVLRRKHADRTAALPYKCVGYPVVPAVYVLAMAAVMVSMVLADTMRWKVYVGLGFIAVGAGVYWLAFGRKGPSASTVSR
jgi:basic amino acid/polyamine antiporter, APA family